MSAPVISDLRLRAYFASVIGPTRAPYGQKKFFDFTPGTFLEIAQNSTRDRVLFVFVSRADIVGGGLTVATFSQSTGGAASSDFTVSFATTGRFTFILYPNESLSLQTVGAAQIVKAEESY